MSRKIVLVSCVSKKQKSPALAKELYVSNWFKKATAYAKKYADSWYILSAKHGLVDPNVILTPYNETLTGMPTYLRKEWANRVLRGLSGELQPGDHVIFLAGKKYRENLVKAIEEMGCSVEIPLRSLRIGEQLSWFKKHLGT